MNKNKSDQDSILVRGFLPLDSGNLDTLKNDLVKSLANTPTSQASPSVTELFLAILPNDIWQEAWKVFIKKQTDNINEATPELLNYVKIELKSKILEELQETSTDGSSLLPNLKNLLIRPHEQVQHQLQIRLRFFNQNLEKWYHSIPFLTQVLVRQLHKFGSTIPLMKKMN